MNVCLYSPTAPQTLLSLGQLHSCGGSFYSSSRPDNLVITADGSTLLDTSPLTPHTNLYPTNHLTLLAALRSSPHLTASPSDRPGPSIFPPTLNRFIARYPPPLTLTSPTPLIPHLRLRALAGSVQPNDTPTNSSDAAIVPPPSAAVPAVPLILPPTQRISKEQYSRVLAAIQLHNDTAHTPDPQLCLELSTGKHSYSALTPNDITLMRRIVGPCPQCT